MLSVNYTNDKFIFTPLPENCAPRHELLNLYNRAVKTRLAVVSAPAGYGKTISTLLWVKESGRKPVWIGLDEYDNAPFLFYKLFCTAILSVQPDNILMQEVLTDGTFNSAPIEHTIRLLSEFTPDEHSYALILDDLHTISNKKILKSLPYILKRLPHSFDILLLSRGNLPEELTEFMENRNGTVITANDLAFSAEEIYRYFNSLGRDITKKQAQTIFNITDGWAIGINALSKSENIEPLQGGGQILENYISKNIWEKWDRVLREFMLVTSIADELDIELCSILTGRKKAGDILDRLIVQNSFIIKTSVNTYRYHRLFLEFLRNKLKERPDINVGELNIKIADQYFERQNYFTALGYYVRAKSNEGINESLYKLNTMYQDYSVEEWLSYFTVLVQDKLSDEFVKGNFALLLEYTWVNFLKGNADATLRYFDMINDYLASEDNRNLIKKDYMIASVITIRFADFRRSLYEYTEDFSKWVKALPKESYSSINVYTPSITQNFPIMHRSVCDCLEIVQDMDNKLQAIKDSFGIFFFKEVDLFCYCVKAGLYYEQNEIEKAYDTIIFAQSTLKKDTRFEMQFCAFMLLSLILNATEKKKEAESTRIHFLERINKENALFLRPNFYAIDAKIKLWDADRETANMWLEQFFVTYDEKLLFYKLYQYFTTVRAYIVLAKPNQAMEYIEKLIRLGSDYNRPLDTAEASVLKAVLEWATGSKNEAVKTLEAVLLVMQPYRVIRIVADEGAAVLPILKRINARAERVDYDGQLDRHYLKQVFYCAYRVSKRHKGIAAYLSEKPVKLSKQQKNILMLLAQGYKNAEIVDMTGLTINTIKSHTRMAYLKLNVNNAADAILKAKQLGIIES